MHCMAWPSTAPTLSVTGCANRTSKPWNVTLARDMSETSRVPF